MKGEAESFDRLIDAVIDGVPVEWEDETFSSHGEFELVDSLRKLGNLAQAFKKVSHRTESASPNSDDREDEILFTWGHLRVRDKIGQGSFGEVYRAYDPVLDRDVALKLMRSDYPSLLGNRSYHKEGRQLARVRHPHVLAVHGAAIHNERTGIWADLIHGQTLAQELRSKGRFGFQECLSLTADLTEALSAVHRAGLIHGDVKPSNVMRQDDGRLILMDFGAVTEFHLDKDSETTAPVVGTPLAMAPELFEGKTPTPAADMYALGALLFRMATCEYVVHGRTVQELIEKHQKGLRNAISDFRPDYPKSFRRLIDALLDPIPANRPTAKELIERLNWIKGAPNRRRKNAAISIVMGSLTIGLIISAIGFFKTKAAAIQARAAQEQSQAAFEFLRDTLSSPMPGQKGIDVKVVDVISDASDKAHREFHDKPKLLIEVLDSLGNTYFSLGDLDKAHDLIHEGFTLSERHYGHLHPHTIIRGAALINTLIHRSQYDKAQRLLDDLLERCRQGIGEDHPHFISLLVHAGHIAMNKNEFSRASDFFDEAVQRCIRVFGEGNIETLRALQGASIVKFKTGDFKGAEALFKKILDVTIQESGDMGQETLNLRNNLAVAQLYQGNFHRAEKTLRANLKKTIEIEGPNHFNTLARMDNLANVLVKLERFDEAEQLYLDALPRMKQTLGSQHPTTRGCMSNLAIVYRQTGQPDKAEPLLQEALHAAREAQDYLAVAQILQNLGVLYQSQGAHTKALEHLREGKVIWETYCEPDHPIGMSIDVNTGSVLWKMGRFREAEKIHREAYQKSEGLFGHDNPKTLDAKLQLAHDLEALRQFEDALNLLLELRDSCQHIFGIDHSNTRDVMARVLTISHLLGLTQLEGEVLHQLASEDIQHPDAPCRSP